MREFRARACSACQLRFPVDEGSSLGASCPICGAETGFADAPYPTLPAAATPAPTGPPVLALLDNVRSIVNVGTIFRSADGAGVSEIHLAGITPTPKHPKLAKTSLGAEQAVPWTHHKDALVAARTIRARGVSLWAVEGGETTAVFDAAPGDGPVCLVLGHEVSGVDPRVLDLCEQRVHIPMAGVKTSLNVAVAFSLAAYVLRHRLTRSA